MDKLWKIILPSGHTAFENHVSTINPLTIRLTYLMRDTFGFGDNVITEELATTDVVVVVFVVDDAIVNPIHRLIHSLTPAWPDLASLQAKDIFCQMLKVEWGSDPTMGHLHLLKTFVVILYGPTPRFSLLRFSLVYTWSSLVNGGSLACQITFPFNNKLGWFWKLKDCLTKTTHFCWMGTLSGNTVTPLYLKKSIVYTKIGNCINYNHWQCDQMTRCYVLYLAI